MLDPYPLSLAAGFLVGLRHATEADHIVAVSTLISEERTLQRALRIGASWGLGHTAALLAAATCVLLFERAIPIEWSQSFEFVVASVIVFLGARLLRRSLTGKYVHSHPHRHGERSHSHLHFHDKTEGHTVVQRTEPLHRDHVSSFWGRSLVVGVMHGLAGSGALTIAFLTPLAGHGSAGRLWMFLLLFGCGSTLGMMMMSAGLSFPLKRLNASAQWTRLTHAVAGLGSIGFGIAYAWRLI